MSSEQTTKIVKTVSWIGTGIAGAVAVLLSPALAHWSAPLSSKVLTSLATFSGQVGIQWFNGTYQNETIWDYSTDYTRPNYGTHDWIADHAKNWLPAHEREFIDREINAFLLGTEAPDNANLSYLGPNTGYGDFPNHHMYFAANCSGAIFDGAARRSAEEFTKADTALPGNEQHGAYYAGSTAHYISDMAVFGHVMGQGSPLGEEVNHTNFERGANAWMQRYEGGYFERFLTPPSLYYQHPHSAAYYVGLDTACGVPQNTTRSALWMDQNYPGNSFTWDVTTNAAFTNSVGDSLNRAVHAVARVLHDLALRNGYALQRLAGTDRYRTAIAISKESFPTSNSASAVIVARADDFPDALAGAPLAALKNAPILLASPTAISDLTKSEIARVIGTSGKTIYLLGGEASLNLDVENNLRAAFGHSVVRLAGNNRVQTAVAIANQFGTSSTRAFIVAKEHWPDAISISPVASRDRNPILLTSQSVLDPAVSAYLSAHPEVTTLTIVGGSAVVAPAVESSLRALSGRTVERLAGTDRFDTNQKIVNTFYTNNAKVAFATGEHFVDGLTGAVLAGKKAIPIVLVAGSDQGRIAATSTWIGAQRSRLIGGYVFGGEVSINRATQLQLGTSLY